VQVCHILGETDAFFIHIRSEFVAIFRNMPVVYQYLPAQHKKQTLPYGFSFSARYFFFRISPRWITF